MQFEFSTATRIIFGAGRAREIGTYAPSKVRRAMVVIGRSMARAEMIIEQLKKQIARREELVKKRQALVDELLERDEFSDYWALKWGDLMRIKSEYPSNLWPNAVQAYHHWIRESLRRNKPYDQFVRELLTASGTIASNPPARNRASIIPTPSTVSG